MINFYRDMWQKLSELLAALIALTSKNGKYDWKEEHQNCFDAIKFVIGCEVLLAYTDFNYPLKYILMLPNYKLVQSYHKRSSLLLSIHER